MLQRVGRLLVLSLGFAAASVRLNAQEPPRDSTARDTLPRDTLARSDSIYSPESMRGYLFGTFGPRPVFRALALAGYDQWRRRPQSFPPNWRGFEDRLGSRYGQVAISHTLRFALSRTFDQRTMRYRLCTCTGRSDRFVYALVAPLRVSTPNGIRLSAFNPLTELTSGVLVTAVRPGGFHVADGLAAGATGVIGESAIDLVREFWPWHWRPPFL